MRIVLTTIFFSSIFGGGKRPAGKAAMVLPVYSLRSKKEDPPSGSFVPHPVE